MENTEKSGTVPFSKSWVRFGLIQTKGKVKFTLEMKLPSSREIELDKDMPSLLFSLFLWVSYLFPTQRMIIQYSCQNQNLPKSSIWNIPVCVNNYMRAMLKWGSLKIDEKRNRGKLIHVGHQRIASVPSLELSITCCRTPAIWCAHLICSPIVNNLQEHGCACLLEKNIDKWRNPVG